MIMATICTIVIFLGLYSLYNVNQVNNSLNSMYNTSLMSTQYLAKADHSFQQMRVAKYRNIVATDPQEMQTYSNDAENNYTDTEKYLKQYHSTGLSARETADLNTLQSFLDEYKTSVARMVAGFSVQLTSHAEQTSSAVSQTASAANEIAPSAALLLDCAIVSIRAVIA